MATIRIGGNSIKSISRAMKLRSSSSNGVYAPPAARMVVGVVLALGSLLAIYTSLMQIPLSPEDSQRVPSSALQGQRQGGPPPHKGLLLPRAMELMRSNVPVTTEFPVPPAPPSSSTSDGSCSCRNPDAEQGVCCNRVIRREHKMGVVMTQKVFRRPYKGQLEAWNHVRKHPNIHMNFTSLEPGPGTAADFRDVFVFRNIYSALISGYKYHKALYECRLNALGKPMSTPMYTLEAGEWEQYVTTAQLRNPVPMPNQTMCDYLAAVPDELGMQVFLEWVFRVKYKDFFSRWALAREVPYMRNRTIDVCFEDLNSHDNDVKTIERVLRHLFGDETDKVPWRGDRSELHDAGGHATPKDDAVKHRLSEIIRKLDRDVYDGQIAWLDSVLPC